MNHIIEDGTQNAKIIQTFLKICISDAILVLFRKQNREKRRFCGFIGLKFSLMWGKYTAKISA